MGENGDNVRKKERKNKRKNGERKENNILFSSTSQLLVKLIQLMHPGTISRTISSSWTIESPFFK